MKLQIGPNHEWSIMQHPIQDYTAKNSLMETTGGVLSILPKSAWFLLISVSKCILWNAKMC